MVTIGKSYISRASIYIKMVLFCEGSSFQTFYAYYLRPHYENHTY